MQFRVFNRFSVLTFPNIFNELIFMIVFNKTFFLFQKCPILPILQLLSPFWHPSPFYRIYGILNIAHFLPFNPYFEHIFKNNLEKRLLILLYWFAEQQQSSSIRCQKYASFYSKFNAHQDELIPASQNYKKWLKIFKKQRVFGKKVQVNILQQNPKRGSSNAF